MKTTLYLERLKKFVFEDLWELDFTPLPLLKRTALGLLKVCFIVFRGFSRDRCSLHAAALTYITLIALVPLIAVMFSAAKGFGAGQKLQEAISGYIASMPPNVQEYIQTMLQYVENTNFGMLGAIGVALLFYTVVGTLGKVESSFNQIWGVKVERSFFRKFSDYVSVLLVVPILIMTATSINATLSSHRFLIWLSQQTPLFAMLYEHLAGLTGTLFVCTAFTFIFMCMPNTRVRFLPALAGGVVAGTLWQLLQWAYIHLQIMVSSYNTIYGTFASVPIFMVWLFVCWQIVLFGCEVSFAGQNYRTYENESVALKANQATREALALSLMVEAGKQYAAGSGAWNPAEFSEQHKIPIRLVRDVVHQLAQAKMLFSADGTDARLVPARPLESIQVGDILNAMRGVPAESLIKKLGPPALASEVSLKILVEKVKD